jgi:hypothetical protein
MADPCEKKLEYRSYERVDTVPRAGSILKSPADAPDPQKTREQAIADLLATVDADMKARNAAPTPQCDPCGFAWDTQETKQYISEGTHQWRETYSLTDAAGNTITGTALYTLRADVDVKMTITTRVCVPSGFGDKLAMLPGFDFEVQADVLARLDYGLMMELANRDPLALKALGVGPRRRGKA